MDVFGKGDVAVRALSGLWGLALIPLTWFAGRRLGGERVAWIATLLVAVSPFAIRYSTETRMYSMVMVLVLAACLVGQDALRDPKPWRLVAVAVLVGALLLSHYWSMYLLASVALMLLWRLRSQHRAGDLEGRTATIKVLGAMVVGGVLFLPWLPNLLYQGQHTGTPWAAPLRPPEVITRTAAELGGPPTGESTVLGWSTIGLALLGVFGLGVGAYRIDLDLRGRPVARILGMLLGITFVVAIVAMYASRSTYAVRYFAVVFPFLVLLAALGFERFHGRTIAFVLLTVFLGFSTIAATRNVTYTRSASRQNADLIRKYAKPGDLVIYCPDQLGPSTARELDDLPVEQLTFPRLEGPERVDWVDYKARQDKVDPKQFARKVLDRAEGHQIFYAFYDGYTTSKKTCPAVLNAFARARPAEQLSSDASSYEPAYLYRFTSAPPTNPGG
jgi:uncharacterized membrane protein